MDFNVCTFYDYMISRGFLSTTSVGVGMVVCKMDERAEEKIFGTI